MSQKRPDRSELEALLGYHFKDKGLLEEALTHASARGEKGGRDNERLEFLGDRVLGICVAAMLLRRDACARESTLARNFNRLVKRDSCAEVARRIGLGLHLIMASSEAHSGGRKKPVILADACEALLGAIFLEGGFSEAERVVTALWIPLLEEAPAEIDAKTALQEYAQGLRQGLPRYKEISRSGADHAPEFVVEVAVKGREPARGAGASLKKAQQAAAEAMLIREGVWQDRAHG